MLRSFATALAVIGSAQISHASTVQSKGQTVTLDGIDYFLPGEPVTSISLSSGPFKNRPSSLTGLTPLTVIVTNNTAYTGSDFSSTVASFKQKDDVFADSFLASVYVQYTSTKPSTFKWGQSRPSSLSINSTNLVITDFVDSGKAIPQGPYFLSASGEVFPAWRLFSDFSGSFTETSIPTSDGKHAVLSANIPGQQLAVAVPSRLYYTKTAEKPLAGVRLGVKDIFPVAGLRQSNGNRAWYHLYPPATENALPVQKLVDAGAIIVGKVKTSQFANGEEPTADWVDYLAPFNPRGDGYQAPSASSAGSAAAAASYDWLDITLGSDTGGSIRNPAQVQGIYGNRPTHGLVALTGAMSLAPELDSVGILTRDPLLWVTASEALYRGNLTITHNYPKLIKARNFPTTVEKDGDQLLIDFLDNVSELIGAQVVTYDLYEDWNQTRPAGADANLDDLLNLTYAMIISQRQIKNVREPFFRDYAAAHDGRTPFVDPVPLVRWAYGASFPPTEVDVANANRTLFGNWFDQHVLVPDAQTCSDSIMMYVGAQAFVNYRNEYFPSPLPPLGFDFTYVSPFWEGPDFAVPIGVATYNSSITLHQEVLPVAVDFMAARGCDGMLYGLIQDLVKAGLLVDSEAGYSSTQGGDVLFRRHIIV